MSSGKGGSTSGTSSNYSTSTTNIPDWLNNASMFAVQQAANIEQTPYTPYVGEMVAGTTPDTLQAYQQVRDLQGAANPAFNASEQAYSGLLGQAAPITAGQIAGDTSQLYGNYGQNVVAPTAGLLGNYLANASPATAQQVGSNAMQLMSPYTQAVINPTLKIAQQQLAQQMGKIGGQAANVGAFGGSRQGVEEGVAQAQSVLGTESNISNLLAQGYNAALTPSYNLATNAAQQGYGAAGLLAGQLGTGYQNAQQQAGSLANTNLQAGLTAAQQLPVTATAQQTEAAREASMLQAVGTAQQQQQQAYDTANMYQFENAQSYPYQQLDTLLATLGSVPYGTTTTSYGTGTSNQTSNAGTMNTLTGIGGLAAKIASIPTSNGTSLLGSFL